MDTKRGWESSSEPLQLEKAEFAEPAPAGLTCSGCGSAIPGAYYAAGGQTVCERCRDGLLAREKEGDRPGAFVTALGLGAVAAVIGGAAWWAVRHFTGYELGLLAVGVGVLVGLAVRKGSGGRGGLRYQLLAVALVYVGIVLNYAPDLAEALREGEQSAIEAGEQPAPPSMGSLFVFLLTVPFLGGFENVIGLLIIGFALWEAWRMNRRVPLVITGPHAPGEAAPAEAPAAAG